MDGSYKSLDSFIIWQIIITFSLITSIFYHEYRASNPIASYSYSYITKD